VVADVGVVREERRARGGGVKISRGEEEEEDGCFRDSGLEGDEDEDDDGVSEGRGGSGATACSCSCSCSCI